MHSFNTPFEYYTALLEEDYPKPTVEYTPTELPIIVGERAHVVTDNHPAQFLNSQPFVMTTPVLSFDEGTGTFTTRNSIYVLKK